MSSRTPERAQFLADIIIAAIEGGTNYWAAVETYRWYFPDLDGGSAPPGPNNTANAYAVIVPDDPRDSDRWLLATGATRFTLTLDEIERAIGLVRDSDLNDELSARILLSSRYNDAAEFGLDSECADALVQLAVFGRLIYG